MSAYKAINIPGRTSSLLQRRLTVKHSRDELKRKLSSSAKSSPIERQRLRIEEVECQREEIRLDKEELHVEKQRKGLSDNEYRKLIKVENDRYVSVGETLWSDMKKLRELEEDEGLVELLGPDVQGAYTSTLLALYKDPSASASNRDKTKQSQMRKAAIEAYDLRKDAPHEGKVWCAISRGWWDESQMKAGHIVPNRLGAEALEYIAGRGSGSRLHSLDNCLLMHNSVEGAFDNGLFVLMPMDANESPIKRWKIQITNNSALNTNMGFTTLKELDGKEVDFKNARRPAARFLYFHFVCTLLRNKRDKQPGWERYFSDLPTGKPFATMGPYMRASMLLALAKAAGDLDDEYESQVMGKEGVELFTEKEKLSNAEEEELARRAMLACDQHADDTIAENLGEMD